MSIEEDHFRKEVAEKLNDAPLQERIANARNRYREQFDSAVAQFSNLEMACKRVAFARWRAIENLDKYLIQFEAAFIRAGGKVIWARDATEAGSEVLGILQKNNITHLHRSRRDITDEIEVEKALQPHDIRITNQDEGSATAAENEIVLGHYASLTGADYIVADVGAVVLSGNDSCAVSPKIHIVVAGIDRVIPSVNDLNVLLPLHSVYAEGHKMNACHSLRRGPRLNGERDGPTQMFVVLVDNGRSTVLAHERQRSVLRCIRCPACRLADPVYQLIGGHSDRSPWEGPPATVIKPVIGGMKSHGFYNHLSTLGSFDSRVCPVKINFNQLILDNRMRNVKEDHLTASEKLFYFLWKNAMMRRDAPKWKSLRPRKYFIDKLFFSSPMGLRIMKTPEKESFNDRWKKRMGG